MKSYLQALMPSEPGIHGLRDQTSNLPAIQHSSVFVWTSGLMIQSECLSFIFRFLAEPVHFKATSQGQASAMQHDPDVVRRHAQILTDFFGRHIVNLPHYERLRGFERET